MKTLEWTLEYNDYKDQLIDQAALMLTLSGRVKETQQVVATQFSFRLRTPDLIIKVEQPVFVFFFCLRQIKIGSTQFCFPPMQPVGKAAVGQKMAAEISFTNPLPQVLTAVVFHVEGLGLVAARRIKYG